MPLISPVALEPAAHASGVPRKRVLVINYSQTGQLARVTERLLGPLHEDPGIALHVETLRPEPAYPFPWPFFRFFDAFPESAHLRGPALAPLSLRGDEDFDLVILPYQVWFLAPSLPITAFLKHPLARALLRGKPVVTVIACRNMWLMAQEKLQGLLTAVGARLMDNVVLTDPGSTLATLVTTPVWMLSGRKRGFWGLPDAGLDLAQIEGMRRFGLALREALARDEERGRGPLLAGLGAVCADPCLYVSEKAGTRSFYLWGRLLMAAGRPGAWQRKPLLALYVVFLLALIVTVVPLSLGLQALLRPLLKARLAKIKNYFEQPSGASTDRCHLYED
jgi:hypothetical protein